MSESSPNSPDTRHLLVPVTRALETVPITMNGETKLLREFLPMGASLYMFFKNLETKPRVPGGSTIALTLGDLTGHYVAQLPSLGPTRSKIGTKKLEMIRTIAKALGAWTKDDEKTEPDFKAFVQTQTEKGAGLLEEYPGLLEGIDENEDFDLVLSEENPDDYKRIKLEDILSSKDVLKKLGIELQQNFRVRVMNFARSLFGEDATLGDMPKNSLKNIGRQKRDSALVIQRVVLEAGGSFAEHQDNPAYLAEQEKKGIRLYNENPQLRPQVETQVSPKVIPPDSGEEREKYINDQLMLNIKSENVDFLRQAITAGENGLSNNTARRLRGSSIKSYLDLVRDGVKKATLSTLSPQQIRHLTELVKNQGLEIGMGRKIGKEYDENKSGIIKSRKPKAEPVILVEHTLLDTANIEECEMETGLDHKVPAYMQEKIKKHAVSAFLYKALKKHNLLTLNALRMNNLSSYALLEGLSDRSIKKLKAYVTEKGGWFLKDHANIEFVKSQMAKGNEQLREKHRPTPIPAAQADEALKKIGVLNLLDPRMAGYLGYESKNERLNFQKIRGRLLKHLPLEQEDHVFALRSWSQADMLKSGVSKATVNSFVSIIHKIGGKFKDDPERTEVAFGTDKFYEKHKAIISVDAVNVSTAFTTETDGIVSKSQQQPANLKTGSKNTPK